MRVLVRNADTVSNAWGPGGYPTENTVFFLLSGSRLCSSLWCWYRSQTRGIFLSGPELDLLLLVVAPGKKSMLLWQGKDEDREHLGGDQGIHCASRGHVCNLGYSGRMPVLYIMTQSHMGMNLVSTLLHLFHVSSAG